MEWVETTGRTVDEAKSHALDQLGVAEDDAEIVVLDEPRPGLFGRIRGEARVRARVRPTQPRPKLDRRDRKKKDRSESGDDAGEAPAAAPAAVPAAKPARSRKKAAPAAAAASDQVSGTESAEEPVVRAPRAPKPARGAEPAARTRGDNARTSPTPEEDAVDAQQVGDEAQRFVQGLVDAFGLTGTASVHRDADDIEVKVDGTDLGLLVGPRGSTLQAVQELARVAAQRRLGDHETRLRVDVGGYRERRREALGRFAQQVAAQVVAEGTAKRLEPMSSSDRKIIHDVLAEYEGVETRSEGDDPQRCVVIAPANA
jgi:spoIIIJ-associated protein